MLIVWKKKESLKNKSWLVGEKDEAVWFLNSDHNWGSQSQSTWQPWCSDHWGFWNPDTLQILLTTDFKEPTLAPSVQNITQMTSCRLFMIVIGKRINKFKTLVLMHRSWLMMMLENLLGDGPLTLHHEGPFFDKLFSFSLLLVSYGLAKAVKAFNGRSIVESYEFWKKRTRIYRCGVCRSN